MSKHERLNTSENEEKSLKDKIFSTAGTIAKWAAVLGIGAAILSIL